MLLGACSLPATSGAGGGGAGAGPAVAPGVTRAALPSCLVAVYPNDFIARNPSHPVTRITLLQATPGAADIGVVTSTRGPVAAAGKGGQWFRETLSCDGPDCTSPCGGGFRLIPGPGGQSLVSSRLLLGQEGDCGRAVDLAMGGAITLDLRSEPVHECTGDRDVQR